MADEKLKLLPASITKQSAEFVEQYLPFANDKAERAFKENITDYGSKVPPHDQAVIFSRLFCAALFQRAIGEIYVRDKSHKAEMDALKSEIASLKRNLS